MECLRSLGGSWFALFATLLGCSDGSDLGPQLEPGTYRLSITQGFSLSPRARLELMADGTFAGNPEGTLWTCRGAFSADEMAALTDAANAAGALRRGDTVSEFHCADHPVFHVEIEGTEEPATGYSHSFTYEECDSQDLAMRGMLTAAFAPAVAMTEAGLCNECPLQADARSCIGVEGGPGRVCTGTTPLDCPGVAPGTIAECGAFPIATQQCDEVLGWTVPTTWSPLEATLWRTSDDGTGVARLQLDVRVQVDHQGTDDEHLSVFGDLQLTDPATGTVLPYATATIDGHTMGPTILAPEGSSAEYEQFLGIAVAPTSPYLTVATLELRLRTRPIEEAPFGEPIAVTLRGWPPEAP